MQIWDTPGLKRLRTSVHSSYKSIAAALLVYDLTNRESFENLHEWIQDLREECPNEEIVLMLTGNHAKVVMPLSERGLFHERMVETQNMVRGSNAIIALKP